MISWKITKADFALLVKVAERVERDIPSYPDKRQALVMDLNACHSNGCPLDFTGLLAADPLDFSHDILEIRHNLNRRTGQLEEFFVPRYAASVSR
jgi:hypothetical protein